MTTKLHVVDDDRALDDFVDAYVAREREDGGGDAGAAWRRFAAAAQGQDAPVQGPRSAVTVLAVGLGVAAVAVAASVALWHAPAALPRAAHDDASFGAADHLDAESAEHSARWNDDERAKRQRRQRSIRRAEVDAALRPPPSVPLEPATPSPPHVVALPPVEPTTTTGSMSASSETVDGRRRRRKPVASATAPVPSHNVEADREALPPAQSALTLELELIARMRLALQRGNHTAVLRDVERHRRVFSAALMTAERDLLEAEALCALGRVQDAARARAKFLKQYPGDHLSIRARSVCTTDGQ